MKLFEGDSIKPCVERLMEQIKPQPGDVYQHPDIAHIAECDYPSNRYASVISAWRKRLLREINIDVEVIVGIGYRVLEENERVSVGIKDFSQAVRQVGRSAERIARADTKKLDDMRRRQQDHAVRLTREIAESGRKASRQIGFAGRVVTLPRPKKAENE